MSALNRQLPDHGHGDEPGDESGESSRESPALKAVANVSQGDGVNADTANPDISLIVPVYNEQERIASSLYQIKDYLTELDVTSEVIVIDDGSNDLTAEIVKFVELYGAEFKSQTIGRLEKNAVNVGKGYSIASGILNSKGNVVIFTDADGATPISELPKLLEKINNDYDVVIGSRKHDHSRTTGRTPTRRILSWVFNRVARLLGLVDVDDSQCGFKAYRREAAIQVASHQKTTGFCFDVEHLYIAKKLGYRITEVPVEWNHSEGSSLSLVRDSVSMFADLLRIKFIHRNL